MIPRIQDSFNRQGLMQTLGARLDHAKPGDVQISAPITAAVSQQQGFAHAGLTFALGDSAAGYAALTLMPDGQEVVTAEMKIHLLAPAQGSRLRAQGQVIRAGRRLMVVQADVWAQTDAGERHVALMTGSMMPVTL